MQTSTFHSETLVNPQDLSKSLGYFGRTESTAPLLPSAPGKRTFDLFIAAIGLFLLAPVFLLSYVLLRLHGTALVSHLRVGTAGSRFKEYGFSIRSPLARKLRLTRLPALINILKGDMSLVGPRAVSPTEALAAERLNGPAGLCRPGFVCLWWIRQRSNIPYNSEAATDSEYALQRSMLRDLGIMLQSLVVAFYGSRRKDTPALVNLLGYSIHNITMQQAIDRTMAYLQGTRPGQLCFINADCINRAASNPMYSEALQEADLCLADGIGMKLAGKLVGQEIRENVNGTDWFPQVCSRAATSGHRVFLLGGQPGIAARVRQWMEEEHPGVQVCGIQHGFFSPEDEDAVIERIAASGADLLLVAMGAPKQDLWIRRHLKRLNVKLAVGVGGLFDFYSGNIPRAPQWMREIGMEWVFRLLQEPGRMWRRYLVGNNVFLARVLWSRLRFAPARREPVKEIRVVRGDRQRILARLKTARHLPMALLGIAPFLGCAEVPNGPKPVESFEPDIMDRIDVADGFNFSTTRQIRLQILVLDYSDQPIAFVPVDIYNGNPTQGGQRILRAATDAQGLFEPMINLPAHLEEVFVEVHQLLPQNLVGLSVRDGFASHTFGGTDFRRTRFSPSDNAAGKVLSGPYAYLGSWNGSGVPNYLEIPGDAIDADLLTDINASLPEGRPVPTYHPDYLASGSGTNLKLGEEAEVSVTFVHEGAGWRNSLGFYSHPLGSAPQNTAEIAAHNILFPNISYAGSGGGLYSGDKVSLGTFPAGTELGWFLVAQGWNGSDVGNGNYTVYSEPSLNPESDPNLQQHNVLLYDAERQLLLLGFEDVNRQWNWCDNDFNDAVFYVTVSPFSAVISEDLNPIDTPDDADGDGASDTYDRYPNDPQRAFETHFPAEAALATLAFEDLWPGKGDYDFNDLVLDYNFRLVTNTAGAVKDINADLKIKAVGAAFNNGLGIRLPIAASRITQASGSQLSHNDITLTASGVEAGQTDAVIIAFDDALALMQRPAGYYINTQEEAPKVAPIDLSMSLTIDTPTDLAWNPPYDPFLIIGRERGREVHMAGFSPTSLAANGYFNTEDDRSADRGFYKTENDLPWAINLASGWKHPLERMPIVASYGKFRQWAESGGFSNTDWYLPENTHPSRIYNR